MEYLAHIRKEDGKKQRLEDHSRNVAKMARGFAEGIGANGKILFKNTKKEVI
jgi:hypothetical protein